MTKQMKIAVTGATGFIGSHILTELVSNGHAVTALVRDEKQAATVATRGAKAAVVVTVIGFETLGYRRGSLASQ